MLCTRTARNRAPRRPRAAEASPDLSGNVLASLADAVILTNGEDHVMLFNQAAEELTGLPAAQVLGRRCADVFADTTLIGTIVQRTRTSGQTQSCGEEALIVSRHTVPVRLSCSPIWGSAGEVQGTALVIQDLSYQKKLEDEARRNDTLVRLGGLVAGLAHEVKNPLGGIKGAAQLLAKRFPDERAIGEYTGVMIREIDRLSRLVEQLLTLGAMPTPELAAINVHKILHDVLALLAPELQAKNTTVRLEIDPSLPEVRGEEAQLTHVFLNLVKNAVEAMPERGTLTITTRMETDFHIRRTALPGKFLRVELADTGPGFPPDSLDHVSEPFFTTKPRGTGLGLAICERTIAAHGGDIKIENRHGGGARVTVVLPTG